jgi:uncharacterized membrane protein YjgN (DUF898 family)
MFESQEPGMSASPLITGNPSLPPKPRPFNVLDIQFTGSGSEYFRIWIVNLLLLIVTLGLYYPWAKVRKLRYFYGNTVVGGHPLDFHGNPRQMLRGFLLTAVLMGLYSFAGHVSPVAGAVSGVILAVLWPALMRASLQFRLSNTSWRGLRFGFNGSLKGAYMVMLVPFAALVGLMMLGFLVYALLPESLGPARAILAGVPVVLGALSMGPYVWWRLKTYQHAHYALGTLQTNFRASFGSMMGVFTKSSLLSIACMGAAATLMSLMLPSGGASALAKGGATEQGKALIAQMLPAFFIFFMLAQLVQAPYFISRMQNLIWTETGNRQVRFKSQLTMGPLMWVMFKNWTLTLLTLGFYWPFAAVAMARIKLQAVMIHAKQDPDQLVAQSRQGSRDAAGDLAADMLGIDFGI